MKYKSNFPVIVTMLICCVFIVIMNFVFTQSAVLQVEENILKNEYNKIGGKSNYQLLQSIQKKEVNILLNKLQTENPEYIYNLKQADSEADNLLPWDMMQEIDQKFPAESLSETKHILIEYSDLECAQCKSFR